MTRINVTTISLAPSHFVGDSGCDFAGRPFTVVGSRRRSSCPRPRAFRVAMFPRRTRGMMVSQRPPRPGPAPAFRYRLRWHGPRPVEIPPALVAVAVVVDHAPVRCSGAYVADDSTGSGRPVPECGFSVLDRALEYYGTDVLAGFELTIYARKKLPTRLTRDDS